MPIECPLTFRLLGEDEFNGIDRAVMACAYAAQNKLGRLCEEQVYENDVAARLRAEGIAEVYTQVPVTVSHRNFRKIYRLDLVIGGMVYELKAVEAFNPVHEAQVYHYAAMLGLDRIKLLNFGARSIEGQLRRCPFARMNRCQLTVDRSRWKPVSTKCEFLAAEMEGLLRDWGGFLDARLLEEALIWANGGEEVCIRRIPVTREHLQLGHHQTAMHSEDAAFVVTSMKGDRSAHESQLRHLLALLPIRAWQWINLTGTELDFVTLTKE